MTILREANEEAMRTALQEALEVELGKLMNIGGNSREKTGRCHKYMKR